jgi:hypothetical protein
VNRLNDDGIYRSINGQPAWCSLHADPERSGRDIHRTFPADTPNKGRIAQTTCARSQRPVANEAEMLRKFKRAALLEIASRSK